jgi:aspartyl-tRNA(Asn)/glutamyl-tRNA(Gln) amidotransferase subunit C
MAKLTKADVLHVAKLAKFNLNDVEIDKFLPQLTSIIDFVSQLNEVDTTNVEPTAQVTGLENVFREGDADASICLSQDEVLNGTDEVYNGFFKVPAILEGRTDK